MPGVVFLDCETTGLDPDRHEIWELAIIVGDQELEYQFPVDLTRADPTGLRIGRFYERRSALEPRPDFLAAASLFRRDASRWLHATSKEMAEWVAVRLDGMHLVGAVPSFDAAFLTRWLNTHGQAATWHYHLVDVEALAAGCEQIPPPWNSNDLSRRVGVDPYQFDRHTALGDARWAKAIYDSVLGVDR